MTPITKTLPCLKCAADTDQTLHPSTEGASWHCNSCGNVRLGFTKEDMIKIVSTKVFGAPEAPKPIEMPVDLKVYLKHKGDSADEMEAHPAAVRAHMHVTGELPVVGKPMFAKGAHPMMAIPYGEVVRVENSQ